MRIAFEYNGSDSICVREFDSLIPVKTVMNYSKTDEVCSEAVFIGNSGTLYITFKIPCVYYKNIPSVSIGYEQLWSYILQKGYFDFTKEEIQIDNSIFILDCELRYAYK